MTNKRTSRRDTPITYGANGCPTPKKKGYDTRGDAKRVANRFKKSSIRDNAKLVPYRCVCGFFHVGSQPRNATRAQMSGAA